MVYLYCQDEKGLENAMISWSLVLAPASLYALTSNGSQELEMSRGKGSRGNGKEGLFFSHGTRR